MVSRTVFICIVGCTFLLFLTVTSWTLLCWTVSGWTVLNCIRVDCVELYQSCNVLNCIRVDCVELYQSGLCWTVSEMQCVEMYQSGLCWTVSEWNVLNCIRVDCVGQEYRAGKLHFTDEHIKWAEIQIWIRHNPDFVLLNICGTVQNFQGTMLQNCKS